MKIRLPPRPAMYRFKSPSQDVDLCVLEEKWRYFFRFLDYNKDGTVGREDLDDMIRHVYDVYSSAGQGSKDICQALRSWWGVFKMHVGDARHLSSEDEFVDAVREVFLSSHAVLKAHITQMANAMFDLLDVNGDGVINRSEYVKMFQAMGVSNSGYVGRVFDRIDADKSGVLERKEFLLALMNFFFLDTKDDDMAFIFNFPDT